MKNGPRLASFVAPHHRQKHGPSNLFFVGTIGHVMKPPAMEPTWPTSSKKILSVGSFISGQERRRRSASGCVSGWRQRLQSLQRSVKENLPLFHFEENTDFASCVATSASPQGGSPSHSATAGAHHCMQTPNPFSSPRSTASRLPYLSLLHC
jgi:hypothetical protein